VTAAELNPVIIDIPSGAQEDDLIVGFTTGYAGDGASGITPPAGLSFAWSPVLNQSESSEGDGQLNTWAFGFFLPSSPASSYSMNINPNDFTEFIIAVCLRGVSRTTPLNGGAGAPTINASVPPSPGTAISWPALTTAVADEYVLAWLFGDDTTLATTPVGYTTLANNYYNGAFMALFSNLQTVPGSTGTLTATYTAPDDWNTILLALIPSQPNDVVFSAMNF